MISISKILVVSQNTSNEILKSKILYYFLAVGVLIALVSFLAAEFTFGVPTRVALDVGLGLSSLIGLSMAVFFGVGILSKEIESRTIYLILARPITRFEFLLGKILGVSYINILNILILGGISIIVYFVLGGKIHETIFWSFIFIIIESLILLLFVVLFSLVTNPTLSVINTIIIAFCGHRIDDIENSLYVLSRPALKSTLSCIKFFTPQLYKLNVKDFVLYSKKLPENYFFGILSYGCLYILVLIIIARLIFNNKNLD